MASLPPIVPVATVPVARVPSAGGVTNASLDEDVRQTANVDVDSIPTYLKKDCILFHAPETEPLARKIAETSGGSVELGRIRWRCVFSSSFRRPASPKRARASRRLSLFVCPPRPPSAPRVPRRSTMPPNNKPRTTTTNKTT